jgi:putative phosphoesterase
LARRQDGSPRVLVGVISDTHGLVRPAALAALRGVTHILHAGDVGDGGVLEALRELAPVTAVRGNVDSDTWALTLPESTLFAVGDARIFLLHDEHRLCFDPAFDRIDAVVAGHSHLPRNEVRDGVLHFNPGSAGPRRFDRPVTVGLLRISGRRVTGEIVRLRVR